MQYLNITPDGHVERSYCEEIAEHLKPYVDNNMRLIVRDWQQETPANNGERYILIITSAEGHEYLPEEQNDPLCLGVFMHYLTKTDIGKQYEPDGFVDINKLYSFPLGTTKFFVPGEYIPYHERKYDFCFVGQLDPYRRRHFYNCTHHLSDRANCYVRFYNGWNNGLSGEEYSNILRNSKIALVPWGSASLDTFRFYEACQSGCVILSDIQNRYDFMIASEHIEISDWSNVKEEINKILSHEHSDKISEYTKNFWEQNLSPRACAKYILEKIK